ncbi:hypothetical protein ABIB25_004799 [Nakamurella sp. UYEF19]|uniref:hypothetical protein n=1 Tax=Nakamurella sp. UYEF19 TaxID=1756392 RepID=UPI00339AB3EE
MELPSPDLEARFLALIGLPISESTPEDADRFVAIMNAMSQIERNKAAVYTSATDIVQAAKHEMNVCGCPYELPDTGDQVTDARRIRVVHRPSCPRRY